MPEEYDFSIREPQRIVKLPALIIRKQKLKAVKTSLRHTGPTAPVSPVRSIGRPPPVRAIDRNRVEPADRSAGDSPPRTVPANENVFVFYPRKPTNARRMEFPGCDLPVARGSRRDKVSVAVGRRGWRDGRVAVQHAQLNNGVQCVNRLVVGDVFPRLTGQNIRNFEI